VEDEPFWSVHCNLTLQKNCLFSPLPQVTELRANPQATLTFVDSRRMAYVAVAGTIDQIPFPASSDQ
jgi:hypothetical protein